MSFKIAERFSLLAYWVQEVESIAFSLQFCSPSSYFVTCISQAGGSSIKLEWRRLCNILDSLVSNNASHLHYKLPRKK